MSAALLILTVGGLVLIGYLLREESRAVESRRCPECGAEAVQEAALAYADGPLWGYRCQGATTHRWSEWT